MRFLFAACFILTISTAAAAECVQNSDACVIEELKAQAENGDARAQRRLGKMMLDGEIADCRSNCWEEGYALLLEAARGGDNLALIMLEQERRSGELTGLRLSDIIEAEMARAENGDPIAAQRLVHRYETGDGVKRSSREMIRYLTIVAEAEGYPAAKDAAFRLCELYGRGEGVSRDDEKAKSWCRRAAGAGHAGAALVIASLQNERDAQTQ